MYGAVQFLPGTLNFTFLDTLYFGALISPTVCIRIGYARGSMLFKNYLFLTGSVDNFGDIQRIARGREFVCIGFRGECVE